MSYLTATNKVASSQQETQQLKKHKRILYQQSNHLKDSATADY